MARTYDVLVVGAGPAGCAAAVSLPAGARALVIDRGEAGSGRCCGGLLAPDAQAALVRLGLELPADVKVAPEPRTVHVRDLESGAEQTYRRRYVNVNRARFDAWLRGLASERAEFRARTRLVAMERTGETVTAVVSSRGREERLRARVVIGADGARSTVRKLAFGRHPRPRVAIAIQARVECAAPPPAHEVIFAARLTDFYAWAIPKGDTVLVGSAFGEPRRARVRFERILAIMRRILDVEGAVVGRSARMLSRPRRRDELLAGEGSVLLAGEAAGLVSPSSGEGISFAVESGSRAGRAVGADVPAEHYSRAFRGLARRVGRKFVKAAVIFSPRLRRIAMLVPWCP